MSDKLQFLQNRVWKVVIFIEKETTYNWLPMTWGRQHNFTQLAFVEAEWRERRETWQQLWNEKIEKTEKVSEASKQASSLRKKNNLNWKGDWKWGLEWGWKRLCSIFIDNIGEKSTFSHDQEASLKYLYSLCLGIVTYCAVLVNCAKYIKY